MKCKECIYFHIRVEKPIGVQHESYKQTERFCKKIERPLNGNVMGCSDYQTKEGAKVAVTPEIQNALYHGKALKEMSREELMKATKELKDAYLEVLSTIRIVEKDDDILI